MIFILSTNNQIPNLFHKIWTFSPLRVILHLSALKLIFYFTPLLSLSTSSQPLHTWKAQYRGCLFQIACKYAEQYRLLWDSTSEPLPTFSFLSFIPLCVSRRIFTFIPRVPQYLYQTSMRDFMKCLQNTNWSVLSLCLALLSRNCSNETLFPCAEATLKLLLYSIFSYVAYNYSLK